MDEVLVVFGCKELPVGVESGDPLRYFGVSNGYIRERGGVMRIFLGVLLPTVTQNGDVVDHKLV